MWWPLVARFGDIRAARERKNRPFAEFSLSYLRATIVARGVITIVWRVRCIIESAIVSQMASVDKDARKPLAAAHDAAAAF